MDFDKLHEKISAHVAKHLGPVDTVLQELIPVHDLPINVLVVKPSKERPFHTLVTVGMSQQPMTLPEGMPANMVTPYVELVLCLPAEWKLDQFHEEMWGWPLPWLRIIPRYAHDEEQFLYVGHTIPNGEPAEPFGPGTKLACWFLRICQTVPRKFMELKIAKDQTVLFLGLNAIYESEMEFARSEDPDDPDVDMGRELDGKLGEAGVTELLDVKRKPVA